MEKLRPDSLMSLEAYAEKRADLRHQLIAYKKKRIAALGPHVTLHFEDRLTIQYQVQEILRVEKIFERAGIEEELESYNPLIPDGSNWKATMMIEFPNPEERRERLKNLLGIDRKTWVQIADDQKVYAISDEDLDREDEDKTASVHFLRFELSSSMVKAAKRGAPIRAGISHDHYQAAVELEDALRRALLKDLS